MPLAPERKLALLYCHRFFVHSHSQLVRAFGLLEQMTNYLIHSTWHPNVSGQGAPWFCSPDFSVPWAQNRAHRNRACFVAATDSAVSPAHNTTNATSWKSTQISPSPSKPIESQPIKTKQMNLPFESLKYRNQLHSTGTLTHPANVYASCFSRTVTSNCRQQVPVATNLEIQLCYCNLQ